MSPNSGTLIFLYFLLISWLIYIYIAIKQNKKLFAITTVGDLAST